MRGYLSPKLYNSDTEAYIDVMSSTEPEICAEGPARCGKTIINLRKLFATHAKVKGLRSCIVRTDSVDLTDTIKYDIRETMLRYQLDDPRSQIKQQGGMTRFDHLYMNGGECRLGGMNRPGAILGGQYDLVFLSELSQFSIEQYQMLKTRCSGSAGNWLDSEGNIRFQMLADTNPDVPGHWMYQREEDGLIRFIEFDFKDNSYFYRNDRWSKVGKATVEELDRGLVGMWHDRYFKGLRVSPAGAVFTITKANIIKRSQMPPLDECDVYRAMDFGMSTGHPNICLWIAVQQGTKNRYVYREWRSTTTDIEDMAAAVNIANADDRIKQSIIEVDPNRQSILHKNNIRTVMARKGDGSVMDSVFLTQAALRKAQLGEDGGLYIVEDLVCNTDPNPDVDKDMNLIKELRNIVYDEDKGKPVKKNDDAIDAYRYFELHFVEKKDRLIYGNTINKQAPEWYHKGI